VRAADEFAAIKENYAQCMERMFAVVGDLYAEHWNDFFHFAIFSRDGESWEDAFRATHSRYLEALEVAQAERVIDLACGRGGFAHLLACHTPGEVLGIDISRAQIARCRRFSRANLRFAHHDVMAVDRLGESFDAVAFLDAECYLPDKRLAVERIARAMRPGARFLLLAWCKQDGLNRVQEELVLHPFMRAWAIPGLETVAGYRRHLRDAGLRLLEVSDLNERVRRNWEHGYAQALAAIANPSLGSAARLVWTGLREGSEAVRLIKDQFAAALYIKAGFDAGFLRYVYLLAEKPPSR
jgi:SAM-dependent methyltransferase